MTPAQGRAIALAYDALAEWNPAAAPTWRAMAADERRQLELARLVTVIEPWQGDGQPYSGSRAMRADVLAGHLYVFAGGNAHPCRTPAEVFAGRAVHDIFGHALPGFDFSPAGEVGAFRAHAPMYSAAALPALACDNLGQTAWYYFHPSNAGRPHSQRRWPAQKVDFLPEELWRPFLDNPARCA